MLTQLVECLGRILTAPQREPQGAVITAYIVTGMYGDPDRLFRFGTGRKAELAQRRVRQHLS